MTNGDLISRQTVIQELKENAVEMGGMDYCGFGVCYEEIESIVNGVPSAEKTAEWIFWTSKSAKCSNCGHIQFTNGKDTTKNALIHKALYHYCPMCGAKMKGGN